MFGIELGASKDDSPLKPSIRLTPMGVVAVDDLIGCDIESSNRPGLGLSSISHDYQMILYMLFTTLSLFG